MKKTLSTIFTLLTCYMAMAQPANDDCNDAILLTSSTTCNSTSGTVNNATADNFPNQASCDNASPSLGAGVFYFFQAVATSHTITVSPSGSLDAIIVLYSGNCFNLSQVGCIDQPGGNGVVTTLNANNLTVGQVYTIRVYDYGAANTTSGNFSICVTHQQQNCNFTSFSSTSETYGPDAFSTTFTADDIIMNGQANCSYTVSESCSWLTITNPTSSPATTNSNGQAFLNYSITANSTGSARTCTITVNGENITITQNPCIFEFDPPSNATNIPASGSTYNRDVLTNSSCAWNIQNSCNWVTLNPSSGTGDGTVAITVAANTSTQARNCTLTVGTSTHVITQQGISCTYDVPGVSENFTASAGQGNFVVNASSGCQWSASESCNWVTLTNSSGTGNGSVSYTVDVNTSTQSRSCIITIQGETFTVFQEGINPCTFSVTPLVVTKDSVGGSQSVSITVNSGTNCSWSVTENCNWLSVQPNSGTGSGTFTLNLQPNTDTATRQCQILVEGNTITVTQTGINANGSSCNEPTPTINAVNCDLAVPFYAGANYEWQWNGQVQQSGASRFFTVTAVTGSGFYTCKITLGNCEYLSNDFYIEYGPPCVVVGLEEINVNGLSLKPNPSNGQFNVSFEAKSVNQVQLSIFDLMGKLIMKEIHVSQQGQYEIPLSLASQAKGIYILQLKAGNEVINKRVEIM